MEATKYYENKHFTYGCYEQKNLHLESCTSEHKISSTSGKVIAKHSNLSTIEAHTSAALLNTHACYVSAENGDLEVVTDDGEERTYTKLLAYGAMNLERINAKWVKASGPAHFKRVTVKEAHCKQEVVARKCHITHLVLGVLDKDVGTLTISSTSTIDTLEVKPACKQYIHYSGLHFSIDQTQPIPQDKNYLLKMITNYTEKVIEVNNAFFIYDTEKDQFIPFDLGRSQPSCFVTEEEVEKKAEENLKGIGGSGRISMNGWVFRRVNGKPTCIGIPRGIRVIEKDKPLREQVPSVTLKIIGSGTIGNIIFKNCTGTFENERATITGMVSYEPATLSPLAAVAQEPATVG